MPKTTPIRDVTAAFDLVLDANRSMNGSASDANDYAATATMNGRLIRASITFQAQMKYCCIEPGCHLGLFAPRWLKFRDALESTGIDPPDWMKLSLRIVVEPGALLPASPITAEANPEDADFAPQEGGVFHYKATERIP